MIYFDKQIQEEINWIKELIKHLNNPKKIQEDIEDENPIIEAFQKDRIKQKIELYKKAKKLYEEILKMKSPSIRMKDNVSFYKKRNNLIREAMIADLNANTMEIYYNKKDVDIKEEFENFKSNLK